MHTLRYSYHMQLNFGEPAHDHQFKLRCFPSSDERQKISDERIEIYPRHYGVEQPDSFGNRCIYGAARQEHERFSVDVEGTAEIHGGIFLKAEGGNVGIFRYATGLTQAGENIRRLHAMLDFGDMSGYSKAVGMMQGLYEAFRYVQGVTGVNTTAEEAVTLGRGVCQDYAHILLALCRLDRIPCRYIAGMIPGEGATHAWTEIYDEGLWRPLDPTHNRECDGTYIKISSGRDAQDCAINQGVFTGGGRQTQEVKVIVREDNTCIRLSLS